MHLTCCGTRRPTKKTVTPAKTSLCSTCSALNLTTILRDGLPKRNMIPLGSLPSILRRADQCRFCYLVASLFRRSWRLDTLLDVDLSGVDCSIYATCVGSLADPRLEEKKQCHRFQIEYSNRPTVISDAVFRARMDLALYIQLLEEDAHKVHRAKEVHGRRMADTVDMGLVKTWITLCEREHGSACESAWWRGGDVRLPSFVRMVDVVLMSLVEAPPNCRYVALSYVWGTAGDGYWTTKANVNSRAQPAGLDLSILPATISDSIHLTRALGERYLWIDALCIIQDSSDDKKDQISVMELIYSGALVTVVAAGGDSAHAKLPGFSAGSRDPYQHIEVIQDLRLTVPLPSLNEAISQTIWDTRGWTFQELLLPRRRLFFTKYQAYFECGKDVWCEDLVAESKTVLYSQHPMRYSGSGGGLLFLPKQLSHPDDDYVTTYSRVIERYTQRRLTYPSDVLHAITALTNAMTKGYKLGKGNPAQAFQCGMGIWHLNHSLLWQPRLDAVHVRRVTPDTEVSAWPSWAWAGWIGAVFYSDMYQLTSTAIRTEVQGKPSESLVRSWYMVDDHQRLTRLDVEKISFIRIGDSLEDATRPHYLMPEGDIDKQELEPLPPRGTLIFRTQCASFTVPLLEDVVGDSESLPHTIFHILSNVCRPSARVGRIILPSSTPSSVALEFIVLSRGEEGIAGLYDESVYGNSYDGCFLFVIAVRRAGHDARVRERVGLGIIFEQAWLECCAKVETVFLG